MFRFILKMLRGVPAGPVALPPLPFEARRPRRPVA
ncbi:hypothetical protein SAMN04488567_3405 [Limimaricola pyoseonensis]|uniref:Uncharacterized protein n=1 Tax=Limimaricola pyoseonensis TaxID=521013 RepID=A0A1G7ICC0_9RHOB|nr:hypothetical protein SAMN04488567_3405 [Limimaricola pyoseonensis]